MIVLDFKKDPLFLLAILNARLTSFWFIHKFDKFQRGTFPQFKVKELAMFPVPKTSNDEEVRLAELANLIQLKYSEIASLTERFSIILSGEFAGEKISIKSDWWNQDFQDFVQTLKIKPTLQQKDELLMLFEKYKSECLELNDVVSRSEIEIDNMVYKLYYLTEEEIKII